MPLPPTNRRGASLRESSRFRCRVPLGEYDQYGLLVQLSATAIPKRISGVEGLNLARMLSAAESLADPGYKLGHPKWFAHKIDGSEVEILDDRFIVIDA